MQPDAYQASESSSANGGADDSSPAGVYFPGALGWRDVTDARLLAAFGRVDRQLFLPAEQRDSASRDEAVPIGEGQTNSQPYVIALMLQALQLAPGDRILEIGTGSGYQTALLCELVGAAVGQEGRPAGATVWSIERSEMLLRRAASVLQRAGYGPHLKIGDGAAGWPERAPFRAIVVSAAAFAVPRPLVEQLDAGGRLVIPVGETDADQELWLIERTHEGLIWTAMGPVRFVPFLSPLLDDPKQQVWPPRSARSVWV